MGAEWFVDGWDKGHGGAKETCRLKREMDAVEGWVMAKRGGVDSGDNQKQEQRGPSRVVGLEKLRGRQLGSAWLLGQP